MRHVGISICIIAVLQGCSSTNVMDVDWKDRSGLEEVNRSVSGGGVSIKLFDGRAIRSPHVRFVKDSLQAILSPRRVRPQSVSGRVPASAIEVEMIPAENLASLRFRDGRKRGDIRAILLGALAGFTAGGIVSALTYETVTLPAVYTDFFIIPERDARKYKATEAPWIGALAGAVLGGIIGTRRYALYRFQRDTPREVSVMIGVGPTVNEGATR